MGAACPIGKDGDEVVSVMKNTLQDNGEVVLVVDECPGALGRKKDGDVGAIPGPHTDEEAHVAEACNLWIDKVDEVGGHNVLNDQTHLPDGLCSCGLAHVKQVGDIAETAEVGQLQDGNGPLHL
ncbi:hypothetical protein Y1Q_0007936 [Alligator mississippiensis]|uniref:Uncharacterized protein n=1 Tax=Alligator mississippiensis TaxID=8496 RepID=A0A151NEX6_ALLMI|nr:hypothetical protein Y1Q_0007936 [Alligator mississippiensis]